MRTSKQLNEYINKLASERPAFKDIWLGVKKIVVESHDFHINQRMELVTAYLDNAFETSLKQFNNERPEEQNAQVLAFVTASLWALTLIREEIQDGYLIPGNEVEMMQQFNEQIDLELGTYNDNIS